jgi:hypothetical protein
MQHWLFFLPSGVLYWCCTVHCLLMAIGGCSPVMSKSEGLCTILSINVSILPVNQSKEQLNRLSSSGRVTRRSVGAYKTQVAAPLQQCHMTLLFLLAHRCDRTYHLLLSRPRKALLHAAGIMPFTLPPLPYAMDALEPHMSKRTLEFHYGGPSRSTYQFTVHNRLRSAKQAHLLQSARIWGQEYRVLHVLRALHQLLGSSSYEGTAS